MGTDDGSGKPVTSIKSDTIASSGSVDLYFARIGAEPLSRVLGGDSTLNGESTNGNSILGETQFLQ